MKKSSSGSHATLPRFLQFLVAALLTVCPGDGTRFLRAQSQSPAPIISTDRPSAGDGSSTVPRGAFQIESGIDFEHTKPASGVIPETSSTAFSTPMTLRFGLLDNLELQLSSGGFSWRKDKTQPGQDEEKSGFSSPEVGFKWNFVPAHEEHGHPSLGLIVQANLPIGSRSFRPEKTVPRFNLASDFGLPNEFALGTNLGVKIPLDAESGKRFNELFFATELSRALSARSRFFVEFFGFAPDIDGGKTRLSMDGGLLFRIRPNLQLDFAITRGLKDPSNHWEGAFGLGLLFF